MAKFINKKEQVWDLQLTTYGRHLLSVGDFKPTYYAFYDDNVIYDSRYANSKSAALTAPPLNTVSEPQNDIHERIKNQTQYLETLTLFESVEGASQREKGYVVDFRNLRKLPSKGNIRRDIFNLDSAIGDAYLDGVTNQAPAWKVVALQSKISSSATKDIENNQNIPQINIDAFYIKKIINTPPDYVFSEWLNSNRDGATGVRVRVTNPFIDNKIITLESSDPLIYVDEVNTQLLMENFDIEIFNTLSSSTGGTTLLRKFFENEKPQIVDGIMVSPMKIQNPIQDLTSGSVEYYFDILTDQEVDKRDACKGMEMFNKQSYYIDLDFECDKSADENVYYDIYGTVTEPEICQS